MGTLRDIVNPVHRETRRDYLGRMMNDKVACMKKAGLFGYDYWDGERSTGYGGYHYDGRWGPVADRMIDALDLRSHSAVLDVGCGKGYLLYELSQRLAPCNVVGYDISTYAIEHGKKEIAGALMRQPAEKPYPVDDDTFDLAYSITTLHNLKLADLAAALKEMSRVSKRQYIVVESYRNAEELFNLQCWALTCECFFRPEEWLFVFETFGYGGDYEFIFFE